MNKFNPSVPRARIKIRKISQFNFELTFTGLICNGNSYLNAHYSVLWEFMG